MKFLPTHLHAAFDYVCGFALIFIPHAFAMSNNAGTDVLPAGYWALQLAGFFILIQSLMTRYECGVLRIVTMNTHLLNERLVGVVLAVSPWVFDFHVAGDISWIPHCAIGGALALGSLVTREKPERALEPAF